MSAGQHVAWLPFTPASSRAGWRRRSRELAGRVDELRRIAGELLGEAPAPEVPAYDQGAADDVLAGLTSLCVARLRAQRPRSVLTARLVGLVSDLQQLTLDVHEHALASRMRRAAACDASLARLRALPTAGDVIDRAARELSRSCGFDRAVLSRVDDGQWIPWVAHFVHPDGMTPWMEDWMNTSIPLAEAPFEAGVVNRQRPALSHSHADDELHRIAPQAMSKSYAVAPIAPAGRVVGLLHADHGRDGPQCDRTDLEVLHAFASGFGHIYELAVLAGRVRSQRDRVRAILASVSTAITAEAEAERHRAVGPDPLAAIARSAVSVLTTLSADFDELTPREVTVLDLIASGARNSEIAEQLVITEATVKTHVKHILSKLGAANRSQLIALYVGAVGGIGPHPT